jgi:hypothetical protein
MIAEPQDLEYGGPAWSEQFKSAIREVISDAVTEHQRAGNPCTSRTTRVACV